VVINGDKGGPNMDIQQFANKFQQQKVEIMEEEEAKPVEDRKAVL
jgi:hypothetical protein